MLGALQGLSAFGAGLHVGGSVLIVFGQTLVKVGHCIEESSSAGNSWFLPKLPPTPKWRRPDGRWRRQLTGSKSYAALGWALFGVGNIMRFVSMRFAAQTVLSGLGSLQFVLIPVASRLLLGIKSHLSTVLGVAVTLLGNVLIILYGPAEVSFSLHQLRRQWASTAMEAFLIVLGGLLCGMQCLWWYLTGQLKRQKQYREHELQPQKQFLLSSASGTSSPAVSEHCDSCGSGIAGSVGSGTWDDKLGGLVVVGSKAEQDAAAVFLGALLFSAVASFIGAWSVLFSKSLTYVVTALPDSLEDWYSWFVVAAFLGSAGFWVRQSNRGLRLYPASLILPLMQAFWMCMSVVEGGIYFGELATLPANSLLLLMLGLVLALVGAVFMGIAGYISEKCDAALVLGARALHADSDLERQCLVSSLDGIKASPSSPRLAEADWIAGELADPVQPSEPRARRGL